jgi:mannose-1-phosphate guanylyltransferase
LSAATGGVPKQFWRPRGETTLLDDALARIAPLVPAERRVIVANEAHRPFVERGGYQRAGHVVFQPQDRGTVAGVLYGLLPVAIADPLATVLVMPSDHGVREPGLFCDVLRQGLGHVTRAGGVVLFAAAPSEVDADYGWVAVRRGGPTHGIREVESFVEKPGRDIARTLHACGALVSTMVVGARVSTLFDLCRAHAPEVAAPFVAALTLPPAVRSRLLDERYAALPSKDFSRDVLTFGRHLRVCELPASVGWSDLGTPRRLRDWLHTDVVQAKRSPADHTIARAHAEAGT